MEELGDGLSLETEEARSAEALKANHRQRARVRIASLADLYQRNSNQFRYLLEPASHMANPDGAVVGWALRIPFFNKASRTNREVITAVRITYFKDRARATLSLSHQQFETAGLIFDHGQQRDRTMLDRHFDG